MSDEVKPPADAPEGYPLESTSVDNDREAFMILLDATPNEELRALVEEWRNRSWSGWSHPRDGAYQAARELEAVIDDE